MPLIKLRRGYFCFSSSEGTCRTGDSRGSRCSRRGGVVSAQGGKRNGNWFESPNGPAMRNSEQFNEFVEGEYVMQIADRKDRKEAQKGKGCNEGG